MSTSKQNIIPVGTLLAICLVVGAVLAVVNQYTAPLIAENEQASNLATYSAVLPEADSFTEIECDLEGITAVLVADNGAGIVITAQAKGYGGQVPAAVSFDYEGNILHVIMMSNDETPGLGQKVTLESFYAQFDGMAAQELTISDIDAVTGATISSKASVKAINYAIAAYWQIIQEVK